MLMNEERRGIECIAGLDDVPPISGAVVVVSPKTGGGMGGNSRTIALV